MPFNVRLTGLCNSIHLVPVVWLLWDLWLFFLCVFVILLMASTRALAMVTMISCSHHHRLSFVVLIDWVRD